MAKRAPLFLLVSAVYLLDRISKILTVRFFAEGEGIPVIPGVFHLTRVNNSGAAFGILRDQTPALILVSALCIAFLVFTLFRSGSRDFAATAWALVLAGALGNLYDRLRFGYVIDYLDLRVWPVFNIADASICVGALVIAVRIFRGGRAKEGK